MNLQAKLRDINYLKSIVNDLVDRGLQLPNNFPLSQVVNNINSYKFSKPRKVQIPKSDGVSLRDIYVYNDQDSFFLKIINKILYDHCSNIISPNVYSYKRGVRTYNAAKTVQKGLRENKIFGAKLDIHNYFLSISRDSLLKEIQKVSDDSETFKFFFNLFNIGNNDFMGILPGSAVSAFFANSLLRELDDWIYSNSLVYARYADDMIVFTKSKDELEEVLKQITFKLKKYGLSLNPKKIKRFDMNKPIDFLGLTITKEFIDINKQTFSNIKKFIKKTCGVYRKKIHQENLFGVEEGTRFCIQALLKKLYRSLSTDKNEHACSRMSYVLGSVTTDKTLKLIDYYVCDCLNDMRLDCHNRSSKRLSLGSFKEYGYVTCVKVWNIYKMNSKVCRLFTEILTRPKLEYRIKSNSIEILSTELKPSKQITVNSLMQLSDLIEKSSRIIVNGVSYLLENLIFDFKNMIIKLVKTIKDLDDYEILIENGKPKVNYVNLEINGLITKVNLTSLIYDDVSDEELLKYYHESLVNYDYEYNSRFSRLNCFGKLRTLYELNKCLPNLDADKILENSLEVRTLRFYFKLYNYLVKKPSVFNQSYFMIDDKNLPFMIIKDSL